MWAKRPRRLLLYVAMLAAGVRTGQQELVSQAIKQAGARLDLDRVLLLVDVELNAHARPGP